MKIKPIEDRVLIEQDACEETTALGLILPDSAKEKPLTGKVVAIGDKVRLTCVGDSVMFGRGRGTEVFIKGNPFWIMREGDMFLIF